VAEWSDNVKSAEIEKDKRGEWGYGKSRRGCERSTLENKDVGVRRIAGKDKKVI